MLVTDVKNCEDPVPVIQEIVHWTSCKHRQEDKPQNSDTDDPWRWTVFAHSVVVFFGLLCDYLTFAPLCRAFTILEILLYCITKLVTAACVRNSFCFSSATFFFFTFLCFLKNQEFSSLSFCAFFFFFLVCWFYPSSHSEELFMVYKVFVCFADVFAMYLCGILW